MLYLWKVYCIYASLHKANDAYFTYLMKVHLHNVENTSLRVVICWRYIYVKRCKYITPRVCFSSSWGVFFEFNVALRPQKPYRLLHQFNVALRPQKPYRLLYQGRGAQDGHLDVHTAPDLWDGWRYVQCCTETVRIIRDGNPRTSTFHTALSSELIVQCRFTSTETVRIIRDGEAWTSTSTFTQLLSSEMSLCGPEVRKWLACMPVWFFDCDSAKPLCGRYFYINLVISQLHCLSSVCTLRGEWLN